MPGMVDDLIAGQLQRPPVPTPQTGGGLDATKLLNAEYERMSGELPGARAKADKALEDMLGGLESYEPSSREAWMSFASNVAKPTKYGTLGEVISQVGEGLTPIIGKQEALRQQYKQLALQSGYQAKEKNADQLQSGRLALLKDQAVLQRGTMGRSQIKMDKDGNMVMFDPVTNSAKVIHSSQIGEYDRLYAKFLEVGKAQGTFTDLEDLKAWAQQSAADAIGTAKKVAPSVTIETPGTKPVASGPLQPAPGLAVPPEATLSPVPGGAVAQPMQPTGFPGQPQAPDQDAVASRIADQLQILETEKKRYAAQGNFPAAQDTQKSIDGLRKQMPGTRILTKEESAAATERGKKTEELKITRDFAQPDQLALLKEFMDSSAGTLDIAKQLPTHVGLPKATGEEGMIPFRGNVLTAGGTDSADFIAQIHALGDQIAFQKLQAMRAASASGASGLGQVTEKEHDMLRQQIASLDLKQKPEKIQEALNKVRDRLQLMQQRIVEAYTSKYPGSVRYIKGQTFIKGSGDSWTPL